MASALVRLRLVTDDAARRADDTSEAGRHLALIALDGACEYALWLASRAQNVPLKKERAGVPELYSAVKAALASWQVVGWPSVNQMHQARNLAQHAGVAPDVGQLPTWRDAVIAFINSLCLAAFNFPLAEIMLANAVRDPELRARLRCSEQEVAENPGQAFALALGAFDKARARWRAQRDAQVSAPSAQLVPSTPPEPPLGDVSDLLEVQLFAGDAGEYIWLRRARQEHKWADWTPSPEQARRALLFVTGWIVRWEIFDQGYPAELWEAHREAMTPPTAGDGQTPQILGAEASFQLENPWRPARHVIHFQLANVLERGRSPWDVLLSTALNDCASAVQQPSMFAAIQWVVTGVLIVLVDLGHDPEVVANVVVRAVALASQRHRDRLAESAEREQERSQLEVALREIVHSARDEKLGLFGEVRVADDEWIGTDGLLALLEIRGGDHREIEQTLDIFRNATSAFPNLHQRNHQIAFSVTQLSSELEESLPTAIADAERQAKHVRKHKAAQAQAIEAFATSVGRRFGSLPDR